MKRALQPALRLAAAPSPNEIARKLSFASALELCAEAAGYSLDKQACAELGMDKARWSRIKAGQEGIKWEQLQAFMDACGNDAPLHWMLAQRGYDLHSLRSTESVTERELRIANERIDELEREREIERRTIRELMRGIG